VTTAASVVECRMYLLYYCLLVIVIVTVTVTGVRTVTTVISIIIIPTTTTTTTSKINRHLLDKQTLFLFFNFLRTYLIFLLRTELDVLLHYKMSILISMLIHCLLLTKMVFSENTFLTGCNSSSIAFWGPTGVVHNGQRNTKYPSCPERVPGLAPSGSTIPSCHTAQDGGGIRCSPHRQWFSKASRAGGV
jgi:hypothetical protein